MMDHHSPAQAGQLYRADIDATFDEVSRVCSELCALAVARGGVEWSAQIDLGLTEAMTNVVRHGYGPTRSGRITVDCVDTGDCWQLLLADQGEPIPRDRLNQSERSVFDFDPDDLHSIPEGGMGLALIRTCFDRMDYEARPCGNLMSLSKFLGRQAI
jgi:serine/threonine-protein kinase RsbW